MVVSSAVPSGQKPPASGRPAAGPDVAIEEEGEAEALEDEGGGDTADYLFEDLDELSEARHIVLVDDFLPSGQAKSLREVFDRRFADPRATAPERFVWDYWYTYADTVWGQAGEGSRTVRTA